MGTERALAMWPQITSQTDGESFTVASGVETVTATPSLSIPGDGVIEGERDRQIERCTVEAKSRQVPGLGRSGFLFYKALARWGLQRTAR